MLSILFSLFLRHALSNLICSSVCPSYLHLKVAVYSTWCSVCAQCSCCAWCSRWSPCNCQPLLLIPGWKAAKSLQTSSTLWIGLQVWQASYWFLKLSSQHFTRMCSNLTLHLPCLVGWLQWLFSLQFLRKSTVCFAVMYIVIKVIAQSDFSLFLILWVET